MNCRVVAAIPMQAGLRTYDGEQAADLIATLPTFPCKHSGRIFEYGRKSMTINQLPLRGQCRNEALWSLAPASRFKQPDDKSWLITYKSMITRAGKGTCRSCRDKTI
jgi:hypothetical protein